PREVEEFLFTHPRIASVSVFGIADAKWGEVPCAWVKPNPGETLTPAEVIGFCEGRIAHYKIPRVVRIVEEFPMTVTGKIQKFLMREMMERETGERETGQRAAGG
ncbi:MAG: hypothetical protein B7Z64_10215, partial [Acidiphilium sp. 21-68-69]